MADNGGEIKKQKYSVQTTRELKVGAVDDSTTANYKCVAAGNVCDPEPKQKLCLSARAHIVSSLRTLESIINCFTKSLMVVLYYKLLYEDS